MKFEIEPDPGQSALVQRDDAQVESSLKLRWLCGPDHQGDGGGRVQFLVDFDRIDVFVERLCDEPGLLAQVAAAGRGWATTPYSVILTEAERTASACMRMLSRKCGL